METIFGAERERRDLHFDGEFDRADAVQNKFGGKPSALPPIQKGYK